MYAYIIYGTMVELLDSNSTNTEGAGI